MYCRTRMIWEETQTTKEYLAKFIYNGLDVKEIKDYNIVKDHFRNFKIDREFNYFLTDTANFSVSRLKFFLHNNESIEERDQLNLFSITIQSTSPELEPQYCYFFREDEDDFKEQLNNSFNEIKIEMLTTFYLNLSDENDLDDYEEDITTPPIQDVFEDENCLVCLENKPNIIFCPCNHFVVCEECDKKGVFVNCVKCREKINNKLKIKKETPKIIHVEKLNSMEDRIKIIENKLNRLELNNDFLGISLDHCSENKKGFDVFNERFDDGKIFLSLLSDNTIKEKRDEIKDVFAKILRMKDK